MNQPQPLTRVAGSPPGALLICAAGAGILWGWMQGRLPWYFALVTVAILFQTLAAVGKVYRFKRWRKEWNAIGHEQPEKTAKKKIERSPTYRAVRGVVICAALIGAAFAANKLDVFDSDYTDIVFSGGLFGLVGVLVSYVVLLIRRRGSRSPAGAKKDSGPAPVPVAQALNVPRSAPSRHFAETNLPQYAAALLTPRTETEHRAGAAQEAATFYAPPQESYSEQSQREFPMAKKSKVDIRTLLSKNPLPVWGWVVLAILIVVIGLGAAARLKQKEAGKIDLDKDFESFAAKPPKPEIRPWERGDVWQDPVTGLFWTLRDNGKDINRDSSDDYCEHLRLAHASWRVPKIAELRQVWITKGHFKGNINPEGARLWAADTYWPKNRTGEYMALFDYASPLNPDEMAPLNDTDTARVVCVADSQ